MDPHDLLKSVNDFYQQAWDKLIIFSTILIAFVGVLVPILFTWLQNRTQHIREETIKKELENTFNTKLKEIEDKLIKDIETKIKDKSDEIEESVNEKIAATRGVSSHIIGNDQLRVKNYKEAILQYCIAGTLYVKGKDYINIQRVNSCIESALQLIIKKDLNSLLDVEHQPTDYISSLKDHNENGIFTDIIKKFERIMNEKLEAQDQPKTV